MTLSRRTALRALGLSPLAAKATADAAIAEATGVLPTPSGDCLPSLVSASDETWRRKVLRFLAAPFLPDWLEEELRERNRHVGYLDPDIACKRSWSMSVKIVTQRQRNVERDRINVVRGTRRALRSREFQEKFGVYI